MKENAPEKLYVDVRDNLSDSILYGFTEKRTDEDIEYIRTDAFIEKAKKWFEENFMNVHRWEISTYEFENIQSMIDEVRNYMKGE